MSFIPRRVHRPAEHVCEHCGAPFISIYNLKKHVTIAHSDASGETHACDRCAKTFTNPLSLKRHRLTHGEKSLACSKCGKMFLSQSHLKQHMLAHSEARPYVCGACKAGFKTKDKLQRHQRGHCTKMKKAKKVEKQADMKE